MITVSDLLRISYTADLTEGGIAYANRSLPHTYDRMGGSPFERLRRIVAGVAVELAFRRYLSNKISHLMSRAQHRSRIRIVTMFRSADIVVISNHFSSRIGLKSLRFARTRG